MNGIILFLILYTYIGAKGTDLEKQKAYWAKI